MKAFSLSLFVLAALTACDGGNPETDEAAAPADTAIETPTPALEPPVTAAPRITEIPAAIRGRWGLVPADCEPGRSDAKGLLTITAGIVLAAGEGLAVSGGAGAAVSAASRGGACAVSDGLSLQAASAPSIARGKTKVLMQAPSMACRGNAPRTVPFLATRQRLDRGRGGSERCHGRIVV